MKKNQRKTQKIRKIIFIFFIAFICILALYKITKTIINLDLFQIQKIVIKGERKNSLDLLYLQGANIFTLDLNALSKKIKEQNYYIEEVKIEKNFPNTLLVYTKLRTPLAKIKLETANRYEYFYIDSEGMLLDINDYNVGDIISIEGLTKRVPDLQAGTLYHDDNLDIALTLIKEKNLCPDLKLYGLSDINVRNQNNVAFFIKSKDLTSKKDSKDIQGIKVIISKEDMKQKLTILAKLLKRLENRLEKVQYIDFRFKEPLLKERR